jgi:Domain of unknown function (DUF222)
VAEPERDETPSRDSSAAGRPARRARPPSGRPRVPEAIGAGFTREPGPTYPVWGAAGFEEGGPADVMPPCAKLAELTGQAHRTGLDQLTDDELVGVLRAARRGASWQSAIELAAVAELHARRSAQATGPGPGAFERTAAELGVALTLTSASAQTLADLAVSLSRLSAVADGLACGHLDVPRARVFAEELGSLPYVQAAAIATEHTYGAPNLTTSQLRARLRRAVMTADPQALRRRQQEARKDARVSIYGEPSGNTALAGRELPTARAVQAYQHVTALAKSMQAAGMPGRFDQIRAAVFLALLTGQSPESLLSDPPPSGADDSGQASADESAASASAQDAETSSGAPGPADAEPRPGGARISWPSGPAGTVHLTMPMTTWLGLSPRPGQVSGYGPVDAWTARQLATCIAGQPGVQYCLTITTPDGQPAGHACTTSPPPSTAPASGPAPPGSSLAARPLAAAAEWVAGLTIQWLQSGQCDHSRQTTAYRPGPRLTHLIKVRSPVCTAPGCNRPSQRSDIDHVIPYGEGGRTCECNTHPPCRRHHRLKGSAGWHVEMPEPGVLRWHLPHGRTYTTTPAGAYPD